jgi:hypothetical protein
MELIYAAALLRETFLQLILHFVNQTSSGKGRGIIYVLVISYIKGIVSRDEFCFEGL